MTRCALYARLSKDDAKTGLGTERQIADCEALAARRGWPVVRRYVDGSTSAYSGKRRPAYEAMMAALVAGTIDTIVVHNTDRLYRRMDTLVSFCDAVTAAGATVESVGGGIIDLTTADGRMHARFLGVVAAHQSERASERIKAQRKQLRAAGKPMGGWRSYGETVDHEVDETEAAFIRQAVARLLAGQSLRSTTERLNAAGSRSSRGTQWRPNSLKASLLRDHSAILSADDADQLRRTLCRPENAIRRGRAPGHLLSGILRCGKPKADGSLCGAKLVVSLGKYRCPARLLGGCNGLAIRREATDAQITKWVLSAIGRTRPTIFTPADADVQRLAELRRRVDEVACDTSIADRLIGMRVAALETEIANTETRIQLASEQQAVAAAAATLRSRWDTLDIDAKRTALRTVVKSISVAPSGPARKLFDPGRLTIEYVYDVEFEHPDQGVMGRHSEPGPGALTAAFRRG
jgi:site-specific DNA recombinase